MSRFDDPSRGHVRCSASPLIAGDLRRRGWQVREDVLEPEAHASAGDSWLFTATYLDRAGGAVGFGVAAHHRDTSALDAAAEAVVTWCSILRTRRLLVADADLSCAGARRARQLISRPETAGREPRYVLGESPALEELGPSETKVVHSLDDVPPTGTVVFPPYGVAPRVRAEAAARGFEVIDATCPLVAATHANLRRFAQDGDTVAVVGETGRAAETVLLEQVNGSAVAVKTPAEVNALQAEQGHLSYVVANGADVGEAIRLASALRARHPRLRAQHPDGLCYATSDRAETARSVSVACDTTLVLDPARTHEWAELVADGPRVHRIADSADIQPAWLAHAGTVGLVAATPDQSLTEAVVEALSGLGPLSVARRSVTTEIDKGW
ncbi:hypothetical protein ACPZ19_40930 [Amycolatopsis lurida]